MVYRCWYDSFVCNQSSSQQNDLDALDPLLENFYEKSKPIRTETRGFQLGPKETIKQQEQEMKKKMNGSAHKQMAWPTRQQQQQQATFRVANSGDQ